MTNDVSNGCAEAAREKMVPPEKKETEGVSNSRARLIGGSRAGLCSQQPFLAEGKNTPRRDSGRPGCSSRKERQRVFVRSVVNRLLFSSRCLGRVRQTLASDSGHKGQFRTMSRPSRKVASLFRPAVYSENIDALPISPRSCLACFFGARTTTGCGRGITPWQQNTVRVKNGGPDERKRKPRAD